MKFLLDTHVFLWMFGGKKLSDQVRNFLTNRKENEFFVSHVVGWEISIKYGLGKLHLPDKPELFVPDRMRRAGLTALQIDLLHVLKIHSLPLVHRDPFDRLLVSQAIAEDMILCSDDPIFASYDVRRLTLQEIS